MSGAVVVGGMPCGCTNGRVEFGTTMPATVGGSETRWQRCTACGMVLVGGQPFTLQAGASVVVAPAGFVTLEPGAVGMPAGTVLTTVAWAPTT